MNKMSRWSVLTVLIITCSVFMVLVLYPKKEPITSWHSPRMLEIAHEWGSLMEEYNIAPVGEETGEKYGLKNEKLYEMLDNILEKHLSKADLRQLAETCGELPAHAWKRSEFANAVLEYMTMRFIRSGDRENLLKLLSTRFPDQIGFQTPIECGIVSWGKKLKDPILLLGEAYSKSEEPEVRHHLAIIVRRAFIGSGIKGQDDTEFVKNAMQWYEKNKEYLTVNLRYGHPMNTLSYDDFPEAYGKTTKPHPLQFDPASIWTKFKHNPLFIEKQSSSEAKEAK